jgi:hypothetical protein
MNNETISGLSVGNLMRRSWRSLKFPVLAALRKAEWWDIRAVGKVHVRAWLESGPTTSSMPGPSSLKVVSSDCTSIDGVGSTI